MPITNETDPKFPFSMINDEDGQLYGYFSNIIGLTGNRQVNIDGCQYHQLMLRGIPCGRLKNWCLDKHQRKWRKLLQYNPSNTNILILNHKQEKIGSYYFARAEPIRWHTHNLTKGELEIVIIGILTELALSHSLVLWEHWRIAPPVHKNLWASLSFDERRSWLQIVLLYHNRQCVQDAPAGSIFDLDGTHIVDYSGFFCAIGEAINGPGGYFGCNVDALADCLCGDYGAKVPFTLRWHHSHVARGHLDRAAWVREWSACEVDTTRARLYENNGFNDDDEIPDNKADYELNGPSLFEAIMSVLTEGGVNVV